MDRVSSIQINNNKGVKNFIVAGHCKTLVFSRHIPQYFVFHTLEAVMMIQIINILVYSLSTCLISNHSTL
jgi:hypothetical protein